MLKAMLPSDACCALLRLLSEPQRQQPGELSCSRGEAAPCGLPLSAALPCLGASAQLPWQHDDRVHALGPRTAGAPRSVIEVRLLTHLQKHCRTCMHFTASLCSIAMIERRYGVTGPSMLLSGMAPEEEKFTSGNRVFKSAMEMAVECHGVVAMMARCRDIDAAPDFLGSFLSAFTNQMQPGHLRCALALLRAGCRLSSEQHTRVMRALEQHFSSSSDAGSQASREVRHLTS